MRSKLLVVTGVTLIVVGVAFAALPKEWIEEAFGVEPDGGNGAVELMLAVVPIVIGMAQLVLVAVRRRRAAVAETRATGG